MSKADMSPASVARKIEKYRAIYPGDKELFSMLEQGCALQSRVDALEKENEGLRWLIRKWLQGNLDPDIDSTRKALKGGK